tara:strand:+ start:106 stop:696 length:591 start_codon:yes stop_codon:yes gene_type:complete
MGIYVPQMQQRTDNYTFGQETAGSFLDALRMKNSQVNADRQYQLEKERNYNQEQQFNKTLEMQKSQNKLENERYLKKDANTDEINRLNREAAKQTFARNKYSRDLEDWEANKNRYNNGISDSYPNGRIFGKPYFGDGSGEYSDQVPMPKKPEYALPESDLGLLPDPYYLNPIQKKEKTARSFLDELSLQQGQGIIR